MPCLPAVPRFTVVLAGGGERVMAWEVGVLAGPADAGLDSHRARVVLGTSAGALVAARLAAGLDPRAAADRLAAVRPSEAPDAGPGARELFASFATAWEAAGGTLQERRRAFGRLTLAASPGAEQEVVDRLARRLPSRAWPVGLRIVAVDAQDGERVALDAGSDVPLARAVAASCAIPTLLPPITVGGRLCVDGALGSATNADSVAGSDASVVLVITATSADPPAAGQDRPWLAALREALAALEAAGHHVVLAQAGTADLDAMGADPMSPASAPRAVAAGRARGRELVAARPLGRAA